jgi:hypothetical protein
MTADEMDHFDAMSALLERVVDSVEKLEIIVHLCRLRAHPQAALSIGRSLRLSPTSVAEALAALLHAGVVGTHDNDDAAGWWFDATSAWATSIEVLVELYDTDRNELLSFMKHIAFRRLRARGARTLMGVAVVRRRTRKPTAPS